MNTNHAGPACEDYEFDVVDLVNGALAPEKARIVGLHVASCARCRRWRDEYTALDAELRRVLTRPRLSAEFDWQLAARVHSLTPAGDRPARRAGADLEYATELEQLRRALRGATLTSLASWVAAAACAVLLLPTLTGWLGQLEAAQDERFQAVMMFGGIAASLLAAALSWTSWRGALPRLRSGP